METEPVAYPDARTPIPIEDVRAFTRIEAVVEVTLSSAHNFWTGFTQNISEGGVFIVCDHPLEPGEVLKFSIRLPPDPVAHEVSGEVRWVRTILAESEGCPAGMGVKFLRLSDELQAAIQRFIAQQRESLFFVDDDDDDDLE